MSFRIKHHHAVQQVRALERDMDAWVATKPYEIAHHMEAQTGEDIYTAMLREEPDPLWSVRTGECLYGFRSALDHLALELADKFTPTAPAAVVEGSEFPIFGSRAPTGAELKKRIGAIDPAAQAIIEALQPHHRGDPDYTRDPLWMLNELCNVDKHRSLNIVVVSNAGIASTVSGGSIDAMTFTKGTLHHGAEVLRVKSSPGIPGQMQMEFKFSYVVSFGDGPPAFGQPVIGTLVAIERRIANDVFSPLARFLR